MKIPLLKNGIILIPFAKTVSFCVSITFVPTSGTVIVRTHSTIVHCSFFLYVSILFKGQKIRDASSLSILSPVDSSLFSKELDVHLHKCLGNDSDGIAMDARISLSSFNDMEIIFDYCIKRNGDQERKFSSLP